MSTTEFALLWTCAALVGDRWGWFGVGVFGLGLLLTHCLEDWTKGQGVEE